MMTVAGKESIYWRKQEEWYTWDEEAHVYILSPDAPERVKASFEMWAKDNREYVG